jgi:hypothetical protein
MTATIRKIALDRALPGMVLGEEVIIDGHLLLPRGTVLSADQLDSLLRREVSEIAVLATSERSAAEIEEMRQEGRAAQQARVQHLFRRAGADAIMQDLQRAVLEYRLGKLE